MMVLGLLLILCVMYLPNGLASLWQQSGARKRSGRG
jgi:branched-chain amino acid transport system permease protein